MLKHLRDINELAMYSITDREFAPYGRIVTNIDTAETVKAGEAIEMPTEGSIYNASRPEFECLDTAKEIKDKLFGQGECQIGYCYGHNSMLNCLEWHTCNEINIAVTDAVLILAKLNDLDCYYRMNSSVCKAFFVPKGAAIEVYSDTLHFCPCEVSKNGFGMVVGLVKGTNTPLDGKSDDIRLWAKNKWLIAHRDNEPTCKKGAYPGIYGKNYKIEY